MRLYSQRWKAYQFVVGFTMSPQKTMKHTSKLQKLYLSLLLFNLLMNNLQFLVIISLEHILTLIVANINFHRSQNLSLIVILRHISRGYKYKKNQPYSPFKY